MSLLGELHWATGSVHGDALRADLRRQIGAVLYYDHALNEPKFLGACFRVHNSGRGALCITASHVLHDAVRALVPPHARENMRMPWALAHIQRAMANVFVLFGDCVDGRPATVSAYHSSPELDIASLLVELPKPVGDPLPSVIGIDSDLRDPQAEIIAITTTRMNATRAGQGGDDRVFALEFGLEPRFGRISAVHQRGRLAAGALYETTIPFLPGMSGSPVMLAPSSAHEPMRAIGVVSSDLSPLDSHSSPNQPGLSSVVPIAMAYATNVHGIAEAPVGFATACERGFVVDLGTRRSEIRVERDGDRFQLQLPPRRRE